MELFFENHDYKYAVEQIMLMLFPEERPVYPGSASGALRARVCLRQEGGDIVSETLIEGENGSFSGEARESLNGDEGLDEERLRRRAVKMSFYYAGVKYLGSVPVWGALCGVRPAKLVSALLDMGLTEEAAVERFMQQYELRRDKARLCLEAAKYSRAAAGSLGERDICLYLGVPFCPTRCAYCSFVSHSVEKSMKLLPLFTEALLKDISATGEAIREAGLKVVAVYFGGGTPTTLTAEQLEAVCSRMEAEIDLSHCREFTVEAGRPDTITAEKLAVLRRHGVTRLSVNPQSMNDRVLEAIGRRHSAHQVVEAVGMVRKAGSFRLNMDLIAGLPEDSPASFAETLEKCLALEPDNITVHTLALKKGSKITLEATRIPTAQEAEEMVSHSAARLRKAGYEPYYLYRQKFMSGGLENVGWCRPGTENLYNICIMEEISSIVAMGGGASTKLIAPDGSMCRFFAPKYPNEYISGIDRICADKSKVKEFYHELSAE